MAPLWFHLTHYNSGWHNGNYDTQASPIVRLDFLSTQPPPSVIYLPVFGSLPSSWVVDRKLLMHSCFCSTFPILTLQCKNWTWMFLSLKFNAIRHEPATSLLRSQVQTNPDSYILAIPGMMQTSIKGMFAAGDGTDRWCMAVLEVEKLLVKVLETT